MKQLVLSILLLFCGTLVSAQHGDTTFLYLKCGNDLSLTQLAPAYHPMKNGFSVKGARLTENVDNERITLVPDSAVVIITFKGTLSPAFLYTKNPPLPVIDVTINGTHYSSFLHDTSGPPPLSIQIEPVSDASFQMVVPRDARYRIVQWEISHRRGTQMINHLLVNGNLLPAADLDKIRATARPGDALKITVTRMERQNAVDELIDQDLKENSINYTIIK